MFIKSYEKLKKTFLGTVPISDFMTKDLMISVHIPKTGGTTFAKILKKIFCSTLLIDHEWAYTGFAINTYAEALEKLQHIRCIHGHFNYPKYSNLKGFDELSVVYLTWLRDPVERTLSTYYYLRDKPLPVNSIVEPWEKAAKECDIYEFLEKDFASINQFRQIGGNNIDNFDFIGITEDYSKSLHIFKNMFFSKFKLPLDVKPQLVNKKRQGESYEISSGLRKIIEEKNQEDFIIYEKGIRKHQQLCKDYL